jgi:polyphosphate kinase 2 (PPK2 family)
MITTKQEAATGKSFRTSSQVTSGNPIVGSPRRYVRHLPERGRIGIFNRSYYEEVLVVRVHPEILERQKLPPPLVGKKIWDERLANIARFEDYATRQGTKILKFFLNVSRKEQKKRFMDRLDEPEKNWKFSPTDVKEREFWDDYMHAFEEAIGATASKHAPWFVVPADNKWFTRLIVAAAIVEAVADLGLAYPEGRRGEEEGARGRAGGAVARIVECMLRPL